MLAEPLPLTTLLLSHARVPRVAKVVAPKKAALATAEAEFQELMVGLNAKKAELAAVERRVQELNDQLQQMQVGAMLVKGGCGATRKHPFSLIHAATAPLLLLGAITADAAAVSTGPCTTSYQSAFYHFLRPTPSSVLQLLTYRMLLS